MIYYASTDTRLRDGIETQLYRLKADSIQGLKSVSRMTSKDTLYRYFLTRSMKVFEAVTYGI